MDLSSSESDDDIRRYDSLRPPVTIFDTTQRPLSSYYLILVPYAKILLANIVYFKVCIYYACHAWRQNLNNFIVLTVFSQLS